MESEGPLPHSQVFLGRTRVSVRVRGSYKHFVTRYVFTVRSYHLAQPPSWRTTPCRLSATAYSIYSQLSSILEAAPPPATWGRAMPWWHGPAYHGLTQNPVLKAFYYRNTTLV